MEERSKKNTGNPPWKERINFNTIVALFFICFSIVAYWLIPYQIEKPKLFMGRSLMYMKPSLFPRLTVLGLLGLSVWYLIHSFRLVEMNLFRELKRSSYPRILVTLGIFLGYALLLEPLGFVASSTLVVGILSLYYGNRNPLILALVVSIPGAIYMIFTRVLRVSLPEFPFF